MEVYLALVDTSGFRRFLMVGQLAISPPIVSRSPVLLSNVRSMSIYSFLSGVSSEICGNGRLLLLT